MELSSSHHHHHHHQAWHVEEQRRHGPDHSLIISLQVTNGGDHPNIAAQDQAPKGQLALWRRVKAGGWPAALLILSVEFCERMATLGIGLNLVTYLHDQMHLPIPTSANAVTNFFGTSFIMCLLGGFVADTYLGRYTTIAIGSCIQLIGMILMVFSSTLPTLRPSACTPSRTQECEPASTQQQTVLFGALYLIALGTGGIKACVSGLGGDQFDESSERGRRMMQSFFNWFGVGLSVASVLSVTVLAYLQDSIGRAIGFAACAACTALSLALFLLGSPLYHSKPPSGSPLAVVAQVLVRAWRNRRLLAPADIPSPAPASSLPAIQHTKQFSFLDKAALAPQSTHISMEEAIKSQWIISSLEKVEEVKMFFRLFPILVTTIIFWTANAQMVTFSTEQASTLNRKLGRQFEFPPASMNFFMQMSVIITLSFYDRVLVPLARKWRKNEYGITSLQRIGVGLLFSALSMVVASLVERKRLHVAHKYHLMGGATSRLPMSVFYLAPQYSLVGIGEAFAYIGQLDFFYRESPQGMRTLGTGLSLSTISLGFFLSGALVDGINKWTRHGSMEGWLSNDLSTSRLDKFYLFLAFCSFLSFTLYLLCSYWYVYNHTWSTNASHQDDVKETHCKGHDRYHEKTLNSGI